MKGKLPLSLKQESTHVSQSKRAGMPSLASADWMGRGEQGGKRRLAYHCIILAAINSLCPVGE